jgi:hypothetical protein
MGASGIAIDIGQQLEPLKAQLRAIQVGRSGYYYIIDVTPGKHFGELILHPYKEGQSLLDFRIDGGEQLVNKMLEQQRGEVTYYWKTKRPARSRPTETGHFRNAGHTAVDHRRRHDSGRIHRPHPAHCLAGGGRRPGHGGRHLRRHRAAPAQAGARTAEQPGAATFRAISSGNFETPLDVQGDDEIGRLLLGLESLRNRLAFDNDRERALGRARKAPARRPKRWPRPAPTSWPT